MGIKNSDFGSNGDEYQKSNRCGHRKQCIVNFLNTFFSFFFFLLFKFCYSTVELKGQWYLVGVAVFIRPFSHAGIGPQVVSSQVWHC